MNLTYFRPKIKRVCGKQNNNPVNIRFVPKHQTSKIDLRTSHLMSCQNIRSGNTGISDSEILVKSRDSRRRTAPLFRHKGLRMVETHFFPMVTIVVLHHKHMKLFKPFTPHVIAWSVRKGFNQSIRRTKEQQTRLQCLACRNL